jgi:hypothetical protein
MSDYVIQYVEGNAPGPFDIYLSGSSGENLYASNVTLTELQAGYIFAVSSSDASSSVIVTFGSPAVGFFVQEQLVFPTPTPSITFSVSITPTPSVTPTLTPTVTPTLTATPSITPSKSPVPSITPTLTPSRTPSPSTGAAASPTPTPTVTRTPSITPSITPSSIAIYSYTGCGYGNSISEACNDAANNRTLYSDCNSGIFGVGCYVYTDSGGTIPLTGYTNIFMNGANWDIDNITGVVTAYSFPQC